MKIVIEKITTIADMREACEFTMHSDMESKVSLGGIYLSEHSPARTQIFKIKMYDIPTEASVHFVRHAVAGQLHFVKTNRMDRGATKVADRNTPINHLMYLNAQHLMDMSHVRLCYKASDSTRLIMNELSCAIREIDKELFQYLMPKCSYLGRCTEFRSCGKMGY